MSSDGTEGEQQLSPSQQDALQTYLAVTGQEPSDAIPLLRRSEWNVQVGGNFETTSMRLSIITSSNTSGR